VGGVVAFGDEDEELLADFCVHLGLALTRFLAMAGDHTTRQLFAPCDLDEGLDGTLDGDLDESEASQDHQAAASRSQADGSPAAAVSRDAPQAPNEKEEEEEGDDNDDDSEDEEDTVPVETAAPRPSSRPSPSPQRSVAEAAPLPERARPASIPEPRSKGRKRALAVPGTRGTRDSGGNSASDSDSGGDSDSDAEGARWHRLHSSHGEKRPRQSPTEEPPNANDNRHGNDHDNVHGASRRAPGPRTTERGGFGSGGNGGYGGDAPPRAKVGSEGTPRGSVYVPPATGHFSQTPRQGFNRRPAPPVAVPSMGLFEGCTLS
jgi:hypothetical protein